MNFAMKNFVGNLKEAYFGNWPTLYRINQIYGKGTALLWMRKMFISLFVSSSSRDAGMINAINRKADAFCSEVLDKYTISTLMVFFQRFDSGRYTNPYDMRGSKHDTIGAAFYHEFLSERKAEMDTIRTDERYAEQEKERLEREPPEGYTSRGWFDETVQRALNGDMEAVKLLTAPNSTIKDTLAWIEEKREEGFNIPYNILNNNSKEQ